MNFNYCRWLINTQKNNDITIKRVFLNILQLQNYPKNICRLDRQSILQTNESSYGRKNHNAITPGIQAKTTGLSWSRWSRVEVLVSYLNSLWVIRALSCRYRNKWMPTRTKQNVHIILNWQRNNGSEKTVKSGTQWL